MGNRETIDRYFTAINDERWEDLRSVLAEDAAYTTTGARTRHGRDTVVEFFTTLFRAWTTHDDDPVSYILDGDAAAVEVRFRGVSTAGTPIEFDAVDVFAFRDGLIAELTTWYDVGAVRRALESA